MVWHGLVRSSPRSHATGIVYRLTWQGCTEDVGTSVDDLEEKEVEEEDTTRHGDSPDTELPENVITFVKDASDEELDKNS